MELTLKIVGAGEAFEHNGGRDELARILRVCSDNIYAGFDPNATLYDYNGNVVGQAVWDNA